MVQCPQVPGATMRRLTRWGAMVLVAWTCALQALAQAPGRGGRQPSGMALRPGDDPTAKMAELRLMAGRAPMAMASRVHRARA